MLNSGPFHQSHRRQRFLEYLVNETLAGRGERLKGYNIALEVFDRPETFDADVDPIVRMEAARIRDKLREYYATDGQGDPIHIDLPKGKYILEIEFRRGEPIARQRERLEVSATAERFDRSGLDPWALQDEVTGMIVSAMTGERGALKQGQYRQAWGKDATTLEEYDYYLRGHDQYVKYTKEGIEWCGEIWREGLAKFPRSPLLKVKLGWHHLMRVMIFVSDDPPTDVRKAGELARQVLANEHLSPQVARLANWLMSYVLVYERDFDGALAVTDKTVALAPYDTYMLSRLVMVLVQIGRPDQALQWADQAAARDPALGWSYNYGRGWAYLVLGKFGEAVDALTQTEFNDAHLLLAIACVRLGRLAEGREEVGKMLKINPAITLQTWRLGYSFRDPAMLERPTLDLLQSGLPET